MSKVIENAGHCANCESNNIDYYDKYDIDNGQLIYEYNCLECDDTGKEYYAMEYIETISDKE
jgi:hypothetical protein